MGAKTKQLKTNKYILSCQMVVSAVKENITNQGKGKEVKCNSWALPCTCSPAPSLHSGKCIRIVVSRRVLAVV